MIAGLFLYTEFNSFLPPISDRGSPSRLRATSEELVRVPSYISRLCFRRLYPNDSRFCLLILTG